jgi:DDE superfamily endonuclease
VCLALFRPFEVGPRLVCLADGIKAPKEGKRMPAVKHLHQQSASNTKPEFIMGHSLQAISLLVHAPGGQVAAVPLTSRIHEGLVFSNRDARSLLDKLVALLLCIARGWGRQVLLVADAYYASAKVIVPLLNKQHHLITRAKSNVVAYMPVPKVAIRSRGRPRIYGEKVRLKDLAKEDLEFTSAPSPVYGENDVLVRYRTLDLTWRPVGRVVRFVIVRHPTRGTIFLLSTDVSLDPLQIL